MAFEIIAGQMTNQGYWHPDRVVFELDEWADAVDLANKIDPVCPVNTPDYLVRSTTTGRYWDGGQEIKFNADGRVMTPAQQAALDAYEEHHDI